MFVLLLSIIFVVHNVPSALIGKENITSARSQELRFLHWSKKIVWKTQKIDFTIQVFQKFQIMKKALKRAKTEKKPYDFFLCMRYYTDWNNFQNKNCL